MRPASFLQLEIGSSLLELFGSMMYPQPRLRSLTDQCFDYSLHRNQRACSRVRLLTSTFCPGFRADSGSTNDE